MKPYNIVCRINISIFHFCFRNEKEILRWYRVFEVPVTKYIYQIGNHEDVQELAQNVFLTCLESLPLFQQKSSLWTWMCRLSYKVIDYYQKYAKRTAMHSFRRAPQVVTYHVSSVVLACWENFHMQIANYGNSNISMDTANILLIPFVC